MNLKSDDIFFQTCRSIGFISEIYNDPDFKEIHDQEPEYWKNLSTSIQLTVFCHLIETKFNEKNSFKQRLSTSENKETLDILFYARNAFVHCQWDISKLDYNNQETKIRNLFVNGVYKHPSVSFEMKLTGDILDVGCIEPICRTILRDGDT